MSTAAAIRQMLAAGLSIEQALIAVEAMEQNAPTPPPVVVERPVGPSAIRMRRLRAKCHEASQVTPSVTSDVTVTQKEKSPTPPKEKTTPLPQTPSASSSSPARRATRLPPDWTPTDKNRADALRLGMPEAMIDRTAQRFRDFWIAKAGRDGAKLDWDATWRNWCGSEAERKGWAPLLVNGAGTVTPSANGRVFIRQDTPQWWAWRDYRLANGQRPVTATTNREVGAEGWWFDSEWPPGALDAKRAEPVRAPPADAALF